MESTFDASSETVSTQESPVVSANLDSSGNVTFVGGSGTNTVDFSDGQTPLFVELDTNQRQPNPGEPSQEGIATSISPDLTPEEFADVPIESLFDIENIIGTDLADVLVGNTEDNVIEGRGGRDTIINLCGNNTLDGGNAVDTIFFSGEAAVNISLAIQDQSQDTGNGRSVLKNFENVVGANGNDLISGDDDGNQLSGRAGNDTIFGGGGNDIIRPGIGDDTMSGGEGADVFSFADTDIILSPISSTVGGNNVIADFALSEDRLDFTNVFATVSEVFAAASAVADGTLINLGDGTASSAETRSSVLLQNVALDEFLNSQNSVVAGTLELPTLEV